MSSKNQVRIATIGWGSLCWDPDGLDIEPEWQSDGPMLPVEFARFSDGERLTLVVVERAPLQTTLWTLSRKASLEDAWADLAAREGCHRSRIGTWPTPRGPSSAFSQEIGAWAASKGLVGVVWTALGPTSPDKKPGLVSEQVRLEYLRGLIASGKEARAREYFEKAPSQIRTPFRELVRRELGWS
jgi:hypothetical protein